MKVNIIANVQSGDSTKGHEDENGVWVYDKQIIVSCPAFIEPYSKERAIRKYGIDVEVNKRIFLWHVFPNIKVGMTIQTTDAQNNVLGAYEIKAIPWDYKHMEILALSKDSVSS